MVTAKGWLYGQTAPSVKEKLKTVETSVEAAFTLMLTDQLSATEASLLHVSVTVITGRSLRNVNNHRIYNSIITGRIVGVDSAGDVPADQAVDNTVFMRVDIDAWCTRPHLARKVCPLYIDR
jgi:hypothetical protein